MAAAEPKLLLLCRVGKLRCALPVEHVVENMRPLPLETLPGVPAFIMGLAVVRGSPTVIVDMARLLEQPAEPPQRLVVVRAGERQVGLAVSEVLGFYRPARTLEPLPPLTNVAAAQAIAWIGVLDGELLAVLAGAMVVPAEVLAAVDTVAALAS